MGSFAYYDGISILTFNLCTGVTLLHDIRLLLLL
jgi:hypothetical protein